MFDYADRRAVTMSWANKEPEVYSKLVRDGILNFLYKQMNTSEFILPNEGAEAYELLIEAIQTLPLFKGVYNELQRLASVDILHAEQVYFGGLVDQSKKGE